MSDKRKRLQIGLSFVDYQKLRQIAIYKSSDQRLDVNERSLILDAISQYISQYEHQNGVIDINSGKD